MRDGVQHPSGAIVYDGVNELHWEGPDDNGVNEARVDDLQFRIRRVARRGPNAWLCEVRDLSGRSPRPFVWIEAPTRQWAKHWAHCLAWLLITRGARP